MLLCAMLSCPIASRDELKQPTAAEMGEKELLLRSSDGGSELCESRGPITTESAGGMLVWGYLKEGHLAGTRAPR